MARLRILVATRAPISDDELTRLIALRNGIESITAGQRTGQIIGIATWPRHVEFVLEIDEEAVIDEEFMPLLQQLTFTEGLRLYYRGEMSFEQMS